MLTSLVFLQQIIVKKSEKSAKIAKIDEQNLHIILNDVLNFNEIFRKNVS